jgi:hypothetical protein
VELEPGTNVRGCDLSSGNPLAETDLALVPFFHRVPLQSYRKYVNRDSNPAQFSESWSYSFNLVAETNNFVPGTILLLCLVSEIQEPPSPGLELRTIFFGVLAFLKFLDS